MSENLSIFHKSRPSPCRRENLPPPALYVDFGRMHASISLRKLRWGSDYAALDGAPDPQDLPAVTSFSCLSKTLILWSCCCTSVLNCTTSVFRFVICPANIPICSWIPSSRDARAPLIAATIAFASDESCRGGTTSVIVFPGACITARAEDVADPSACSRRSSVQCFFRIRRASCTLNSWSSAPGIFNLSRVLCRFFSCPRGRRVWVQVSQGRQFWLFQLR